MQVQENLKEKFYGYDGQLSNTSLDQKVIKKLIHKNTDEFWQ